MAVDGQFVVDSLLARVEDDDPSVVLAVMELEEVQFLSSFFIRVIHQNNVVSKAVALRMTFLILYDYFPSQGPAWEDTN